MELLGPDLTQQPIFINKSEFEEVIHFLYEESELDFSLDFNRCDLSFVEKVFDGILMSKGVLSSNFSYSIHDEDWPPGSFKLMALKL